MRIIFFLCLSAGIAFGQPVSNEVIRERVATYKNEARGPYKDIRWFCKDGSMVMPKESCPTPGGVQRARYKDEVVTMGNKQHLYLGQILANTPKEDFWDAPQYNSRIKQYQLEKHLRSIDDGWILRKAQFYRGAIQVEDEEAWGIDFFQWLLSQEGVLEKQFFLVRQASKDVPHQGDDNTRQRIRALAKTISDAYPAFQDLRIKIHGQPEPGDLGRVVAFRDRNKSSLSPSVNQQFDQLITDLRTVYQAVDLNTQRKYLPKLPAEAAVRASLNNYIEQFEAVAGGPARAMATAELLAEIRTAMVPIGSRKARLALLDLSNALEDIYFTDIQQWPTTTVRAAMDKICCTGMAAMGTGYLEIWEWEELLATFAVAKQATMTTEELLFFLDQARSMVEWSSGMVYGVYKDVVQQYAGFEPLANGFYDDRIRASVLLPLGQAIADLGRYAATVAPYHHQLMDAPNPNTVRGLNPGYAQGELVVVSEVAEDLPIDKNKIYIFLSPPADLKPVAGILTVTEGNMVSHVQLLARNLGIPNAVLSAQNMEWLRRYAGQKVFYAVSPQGSVIMKPAGKMTAEEQALFAKIERQEERISVPMNKIDLNQRSVVNLRELAGASSGKVCGPKAANLGQLKRMFPDKVVDGMVLPFGVFREHMDLPMPGQTVTYWAFLQQTFEQAKAQQRSGQSDPEVEAYTLGQLAILRDAIKQMNLLPAFVADLEAQFKAILGQPLGKVPVFLRSDTNMEDLKDFTGAGLNLTLFNVLDRTAILNGIKEVWASPYTERSFKWRQRYLNDPEHVFPSILIIPSVDVDCSGVLITKGVANGDARDLTIAFSRGAGGAVDGQAAESYLLRYDNENRLLSPAREPVYRRLPVTGGTRQVFATFETPILTDSNIYDLRVMAISIQKEVPAAEGGFPGPFDVELGFKDNKLWLFQIRPFVENKKAAGSAYLEKISPPVPLKQAIQLDDPLRK